MGPPAQRHRIALLTLIVAAWPQPLSRDRAMALLWPERDLGNARRLLNLAVHVLRSALGEGVIASTGDGLLAEPVPPAAATCTSCAPRSPRAHRSASSQLYTGPLLDGFLLGDSTEFGYWLDQRRSELAHAYIGALLALAGRQEHSGDVHGRVGPCRRLVAADPHSGVHAQRADARARRRGRPGRRHPARGRARAAPASGSRAGARSGRGGARGRAAPRAGEAPAGAQPSAGRARFPSVAVLPFLNLGGEPEHDYFADGITEDVIAHLSKIRRPPVISRTSVMPFKQRQHTPEGDRADARRHDAARRKRPAYRRPRAHRGHTRRCRNRSAPVGRDVRPADDGHLRDPDGCRAADRRRARGRAFARRADARAHGADEGRPRLPALPAGPAVVHQVHARSRCVARSSYFDRAIERDPAFALAWANVAMAYTDLAEIGARGA